MKNAAALSLSIAVASFALFSPKFAQASNSDNAPTSNIVMTPAAAQQEANLMVPARVALTANLDGRKVQPGERFQATLGDTVHLKNGPALPRGTVLIGMVATDNMQASGASRLALRFTEAQLKNGKVVPIKATIFGVFPPEDDSLSDEASNIWDNSTLGVDQVAALSGTDLHSNIASANSGVLVSAKKDDVKLSRGSQLTLAIAAQGSDTPDQGAAGGGN